MTVRSTQRLVLSLSLAVVLAATSLSGQGGGARGAGQGPGAGGGRGFAPPVRDVTEQTALGTATVTGTVVIEGAGSPVRRARVTLSAAELRGGRSVVTDDQGRFNFQALPAGRFTLTASKSGFVDITYGAKRAGRPGTPIQLSDGQNLTGLTIAMPRGGVITGIVVDEHGEPAPGTPVRALRYVMQTGERRLQQAGQDQTDDRGMYRIFQLQPGDYIVNAIPRNMNTGDVRQALATEVTSLMQQLQASGIDPNALTAAAAGQGGQIGARLAQLQQQMAAYEQEQPTAYAPVYYPGTTTAESAVTLALNAGEERAGVDFRLQLVPTTRVGGIVVSPAGALPPATQVALVPRRADGMPAVPGLGNSMARVGGDGRFSFNNVTPGDYSLQARATLREPVAAPPAGARGRGAGQGPIAQVLWAVADVSIGGQPLPDIVLNLQAGMTVSGQVRFEGAAQPPADLSVLRVSLAARGPQAFEIGGIPPTQADASGRFSIPGVSPGRYSLTATMAGGGGGRGGRGGAAAAPGAAGQWMLQSAMYNGQDLLDFPVDIAPNQSLQNVLLTYTDKMQELTGTIQDTSGRPTSDFTIIVFPSEPRFWMPQARRITATRPGTDGRFTFRGLPAGNYRLTAVTDVEPGEWYDPAFLNQLGSVSIPISLSEGERKVQDIRLAGG
ncbi:MAG: carboxypeptidase regulatory-like domain-containing protein [Acidobacteria bacterium]|nr:carboxypeptidase regulatory-like domain-containing protein [Acidobacteriota bacterium]